MTGAHTIPEERGPLTKTTIIILRPAELPVTQELELEERPGLTRLKAIVEPHLDGGTMERVAVLYEGQRTDMFVDDWGVAKKLERNEAATEIYRANWLAQHPADDPENSPAILGPAVLFTRRVWF